MRAILAIPGASVVGRFFGVFIGVFVGVGSIPLSDIVNDRWEIFFPLFLSRPSSVAAVAAAAEVNEPDTLRFAVETGGDLAARFLDEVGVRI